MIEHLSKKFLENFDEKSAIDVIHHLNTTSQPNTSVLYTKYFLRLFKHSFNIKHEYAKSLKNLEKYEESFVVYEDLLNNYNITHDVSSNLHIEQSSIIENVKYRYNYYNTEIVNSIKSKNLGLITFTMTTCRRYELFEKTMNSFLNCCTDLDMIDRWIIVDDNSSDEDRLKMKTNYPFIEFVYKSSNMKGHANSMNIIKQYVNTPYLIHMEDDFLFFKRRSYINDAIYIINDDKDIKQCLFNNNYGEVSKDIHWKGGYNISSKHIRYNVHEYTETQKEKDDFSAKFPYQPNCAYWPHFSFRPSVIDTSVFKISDFNQNSGHFEMDFAYKYIKHSFKSAFFEGLSCIHIGRLTSERNDHTKLNAYILNNEQQFIKKKYINLDTLKSFVVNLDRRPDRYEKFLKNNGNILEEIKYTKMIAFDGHLVKPTSQLYYIFEHNDYNFRCGIVGCALSHIKLYVDLANESDQMNYLIFEDDSICSDNFTKIFNNIYKQFVDLNADILILNHHNRDVNIKFDKHIKDVSLVKTNVAESFVKSLGSTACYLISSKGAKNMLNFINKRSMTNGIDTMIQKACDDLDIYYLNENIVDSECYRCNDKDITLDTDIQKNYETIKFNDVTIEKREIDIFKDIDSDKFYLKI